MKIQYCSDLHLEFEHNSRYLKNFPLSVCSEILILAGDIVPLHDEYFKNPFFSFIADNYKQVFWVPGNHEFYHKDLSEYSESYNIKLRSNINIVNNVNLEYDGTLFIFSTLWSKINKENEKIIENGVSDFELITDKNRKFRAKDFNRMHHGCMNFIKMSLKEKANPSVVVTHHLPSVLCNSKKHVNSPINEAFCVDLTEFIEKCGINFWIYGHSHYNQKPLYIGNTILLTNQLGYVHYNEHAQFKKNAFFVV